MLLLWQFGYSCMIACYALTFILFGYTFLLADSEGRGLNGRISRFLYNSCPEEMSRILLVFLGPKTYEQLSRTYDYAVHQRNPIMQIV